MEFGAGAWGSAALVSSPIFTVHLFYSDYIRLGIKINRRYFTTVLEGLSGKSAWPGMKRMAHAKPCSQYPTG